MKLVDQGVYSDSYMSYRTGSTMSAWDKYPDYSIAQYANSAGNTIVVKDTRYSSVSNFISAMGSVYIYYPLEESERFNIDKIVIPTFRGTNVIESDSSGGLTVEYWAR